METDKLEQTAVNDSGTAGDSDARLTQRRSRRVRGKGFVYFIQAGDKIKIGWSMHPEGRLSGLQGSNGTRLSLIGAFPGDKAAEKAMHERFSTLRLRGEWFRAHRQIFEYLETKGKPRPAPSKPSRKRPATEAERLLIAKRVAVGANTLTGHICSNLVEQLENLALARIEGNVTQLANLPKMIERSMASLARHPQ